MAFLLTLWRLFFQFAPQQARAVAVQLVRAFPQASSFDEVLRMFAQANPQASQAFNRRLLAAYGHLAKQQSPSPTSSGSSTSSRPQIPVLEIPDEQQSQSSSLQRPTLTSLDVANRPDFRPVDLSGRQDAEVVDCEDFLEQIIDSVRVVVTNAKATQCRLNGRCDWLEDALELDESGPIAKVRNAVAIRYLAEHDGVLAEIAIRKLQAA